MKTKLGVVTLAFTLFLPMVVSAQIKLTGLKIFGVRADGTRDSSAWDTLEGGQYWGAYLFSGTAQSPKFLNGGATDDSLNPKVELKPGTYTFGFAGDSVPDPGATLELCFNDNPASRISVTAQKERPGLFSGTTTFSTGETMVTVTAMQLLSPPVDLVGPNETKPNGSLDTAGTFTLVVSSKHPSPAAPVALTDFNLVGDLGSNRAEFTLTATASVDNPKGGSLELLSGAVALTEMGAHPQWDLQVDQGRYVAVFKRAGKFALQFKFVAAVSQGGNWNRVNFRVAPGAVQPVVLQGLGADTQFAFVGAARPERRTNDFVSFLPADGTVNLAWQEARKAEEGRLFYAAEMWSQVTFSPGLMRQTGLLDFKVMQGELSQVALLLTGAGEVTRVQGSEVLGWTVEPAPSGAGVSGDATPPRRLVVRLNQPQKDTFRLQVQTQTPLGAFPQTATVMQIQPEGATRFAGYVRIVNEGAVRLEIAQASGLSQISPEQFPENDATKAAFPPTGRQRFAYRFSSPGYALRVQADQIQPELTVSEVLAYHHGENELAIDAELELEVREAPLRELRLRIPAGFAVARLNASGLSDYFVSAPGASGEEPADPASATLRLVYGQPVTGRQVVQLRLERNQPLGETNWVLPRIEVSNARSVRGNVGVATAAGFRLSAERTQGLTEIAPAFFLGKVPNLQAAFRLSDPDWRATMHIERLPQTVQADGLHLFSIGEGVAYGSSVMNYSISGAPLAALRVELADEYFNVEFTGKDIRNWQKTTNGYLVQLQSPVAGAYTLLATYERPFKAQGETLAFTGARPLDAQSEQGYTLVVSAYQFQVKPAALSSALLPLEPGEVPAEYRLFFDAPILAAYHYNARPFDLKLALSPLVQGDSISLVVDRAALVTRISKEGQVLTDASYFLKNRGNPNLRLTLPAGLALWTARVNDAAVVPVQDGDASLIPLPQRADPNAIVKLNLKLAAKSATAQHVTVTAPSLNAPVMLAEWKLEPDAGQRLLFERGSLTPVGGVPDVSGFAQAARMAHPDHGGRLITALVSVGVLLLAGLLVWRWAAGEGVSRFSLRHLGGALIGLVAFVAAGVMLSGIFQAAADFRAVVPSDVAFLAPVQQAGSALSVTVTNLNAATAGAGWGATLLLAVAGAALWIGAWWSVSPAKKIMLGALGWTLLAWAALRLPNGLPWFLAMLILFALTRVLWPGLRRLWAVPAKATLPAGTSAPAVAALLVASLLWLGTGCAMTARDASAPSSLESVSQQIQIEDGFALVTAKLHWQTGAGRVLPLLSEPGVLTQVTYPQPALALVETVTDGRRVQQLEARRAGTYDITLHYQLHVSESSGQSTIALPTPAGLINRLAVTVAGLDVDVFSPQAVSLQRELSGSNTVAALVLAPAAQVSIGWKPRSRDVKREKAVFYAETSQLYVPAAGVIEGVHRVTLRPAQGELNELIFDVPKGATVTDVTDGSTPKNASSLVALWRFDPDTRKLRITLSQPQSRPFTVLVRSQIPAGTLPFQQSAGLLAVEQAANQIGVLGIATGNEVQLDNVTAEGLAPINLEDFPGDVTGPLAAQVAGLTVRRAFRYSDPGATVSLQASPVEPDVRVETQDTLSLGEDRTVLAADAKVDISRAGIFKLSFVLPAGFDVEAISGDALSHWSESKTDAGRIITLNLRGKTLGPQQFAISLAGPGVKATRLAGAWPVPQFSLREASKQQGTLLIVPEQGMQLQAAALDGLSLLDPQRAGIRQKGVLAFRILQAPWKLALDIEQVEPWVQVTSLQHASVSEALVKVAANLQYEIENAGLKSLRVSLPTNAGSVRFAGDLVTDFLRVPGPVENGLQAWEVKLDRRIIGEHLLRVTYQTAIPEHATETVLRGVRADAVNLQRGFVTVQAGGRVQVGAEPAGTALQPTEWQSIPRTLQQGLVAAAANYTFRLADPAFALTLKLDRHEAVKLLPARVNRITFNSVISDAGVMLTQARLEMSPGDKRLLSVKLPAGAHYWFAFVNQNGVWPWRDQDALLIPLEKPSADHQPVPVEIYFSSQVGQPGAGRLDLSLLAPKFDLPLENITWRVSLSEKWRLQDWTGTLQLQDQQVAPVAATLDLTHYLAEEAAQQAQKTQQAEQMLSLGNTALAQGDPQQARRAFQAAFGLSAHDDAFNEDARVQLHNLKLQQALLGLSVRQAAAAGDAGPLLGRFRSPRGGPELNYTQQDARQIIEANSAEDNSAYLRLAEKLVQQQDAAVNSASAIRANIPAEGRVLTFQRAVAVDREADLHLGLEVQAVTAASWSVRALILGATLLVLGMVGWGARSLRR